MMYISFCAPYTWTMIALIVVFSIAAVGFNHGQEEAAADQSAIQVEAPAAEMPVEAE